MQKVFERIVLVLSAIVLLPLLVVWWVVVFILWVQQKANTVYSELEENSL